MFQKLLMALICFNLSSFAFADDEIDDVELGLEAAISESEAALGEAEAMQETKAEEEALLEKRKEEAEQRQELANRKEQQAKAHIADLDKQIRKTTEQRMIKEKLIKAAQQKIEKYEAAVKVKENERDLSKSKLDAANEAYDIESKRLKAAEDNIRELRMQIQQNKKLAIEKKKRYLRLKKQREYRERELASMKSKNKQERPRKSD